MVTKTAKIKNGTLTLPTELLKSWRNAEVYLTGERDNIFIKRLSKSALSLGEMINEFRKIGKNIVRKDLDEAIQIVRREESQMRK